MPRRAEQAVPFLAGQGDVGAGGGFLDAPRIGGAEHDLDMGRVPHDLGDGDASGGNAILRRQRVDGVVELGEILAVPKKDAVEEALLEG